MSTLPRPSAPGSPTLEKATVVVRGRVGGAWLAVAGWESRVREAWSRLIQAEPGSGTQARLRQLVDEAQRLVEGRRSAVAHAAHAAPLPWSLESEPLRALAGRVDRFLAAADALFALLERQRESTVRLRELEDEWRPQFPSAWAREEALHAVGPECIGRCATLEELAAVETRMERLRGVLERWRLDVQEWLDHAGAALRGEAEEEDAASLEARYEALLSIGAVDRQAVQLRTAETLRMAVTKHLAAMRERLPPPERTGSRQRLSEQWRAHAAGGPLEGEEAASYREAIRELHLRRASRLRRKG